MKYLFSLLLFFSFSLSALEISAECYTGAFLADKPLKEDILKFKKDYGKKPLFIMVFIDWFHFPPKEVMKAIYEQDCLMMLTWEPWIAIDRRGIKVEEVLNGKYDDYIKNFAASLKEINKTVFLRFGHEMNGNWYPWSGVKIGAEKYRALYCYLKDFFDKEKVTNVKWVFSVNFESIPPKDNHFSRYYPGDTYVDYIGLDGYNWGDTQAWSKWKNFSEIFNSVYNEVIEKYEQPLIITEFSSAVNGGDKTEWIKEAMETIKQLKKVKAFILFNTDKEVKWSFPANSEYGKEFKEQLKDPYFKDDEFKS